MKESVSLVWEKREAGFEKGPTRTPRFVPDDPHPAGDENNHGAVFVDRAGSGNEKGQSESLNVCANSAFVMYL
jgi:hypothetical protein